MFDDNRSDGDNGDDGRVARYTGSGGAVGGVGTALFAATDDPVWIALGAALGAAFSSRGTS